MTAPDPARPHLTGLPATGPATMEPTGPNRTGAPAAGGANLAARQAELIAALTAGGPVPAGFDGRLVGAARTALLGKRAGEVARQWPALAAALGDGWHRHFAAWAATRPTRGSLRDGWDLARELADGATLPPRAVAELACREAGWHYDGRSAPRRRRWPALRRVRGTVVVQLAGRVHVVHRA